MRAIVLLIGSVCLVAGIPDWDIDVPNYDGYKVFHVSPTHQRAVKALHDLEMSNKYDFWSHPAVNVPASIMAPPARVQELKDWLQEQDIPYKVIVTDVQELIEEEKVPATNYSLPRSSTHSFTWNKYHRVDAIYKFMDDLAASYPELVTLETIGQSYEGRDLKVMKVSKKGGTNKPAIFLDGGIHSREWVSITTVTYMMNELVENHHKYPEYLKNMDWYFMPVVNPDGYEYTHTNSRLWRKTRSRQDSFFGCKGVDPNRNWGYHWNEGGVSHDPCSDIFCGRKAFSEIEVELLSKYILERKDNIKVYINFHCFMQLWLMPWCYTYDLPDDYEDLYALAKEACDALTAVYGTTFTIGTPPNIIYIASGGSIDWTKGVAGIKYSYSPELRDRGQYGFFLPTSQIVPTGIEIWEAVKVMAKKVMSS